MSRRNSFLLICAIIAGRVSGARGVEIIMTPVSASGVYTIVGTEIRLASSGQRVRFEVQIKDFAPELLKVFQASLDSRGYFNSGSVQIRAAFVDCPSEDSAGHQFCRNVFGEAGVGAPRCDDWDGDPATGLHCEAAWINQSRSDWLMFGRNALAAVDISDPDFRWGGATYPGEEVSDEGLTYYAGTLMIDVPVGAVGLFTIGWYNSPVHPSYVQNANYDAIEPVIVTSARIVILCENDNQCDDQSDCTEEHCNLETQECEYAHLPDGLDCDDGNACTLDGHCSLGKCIPQTSITCNNFDACNYAGTCIPETGECSPPVPKPQGTGCSDNNLCTLGDHCLQGACVSGAPKVCTGPCLDGTCNTLTGQCRILPSGTACNDGNPCSMGDRCVSDNCVPTAPLVCSNGDACNDPGSCIPATGQCSAPVPKPDGTTCPDGDLCTTNQCEQGECLSTAIPDCVQWYDMFDCLQGPGSPKEPECDAFDLNSDGFVDLFDVAMLLEMY